MKRKFILNVLLLLFAIAAIIVRAASKESVQPVKIPADQDVSSFVLHKNY